MAKVFDREPEPNEFMEAPCRCDCGNWFDQSDGHRSSRDNHLVCGECSENEKEEEDNEEEIYNFEDTLNDAVFDIQNTTKDYKKQFPVQYGLWLKKQPDHIQTAIKASTL